MKVHNNLLLEDQFKMLQDNLMGSDFPWYYNPGVNTEKDAVGIFQFTHCFYANDKIRSSYFNLIEPFIKKINPLSLLRVKANLITKTDKHIEHGYHTDYDNYEKITTGILYVNTNDGYTKFKNKKIVKSEENKYIEFDCGESHTGTSCTDQNVRVAINFNYIK